jgi:hypothetical protein
MEPILGMNKGIWLVLLMKKPDSPTEPRTTEPRMGLLSEWTQPRMGLNPEWDFCPNGLNPEWDSTLNGLNTEWDST